MTIPTSSRQSNSKPHTQLPLYLSRASSSDNFPSPLSDSHVSSLSDSHLQSYEHTAMRFEQITLLLLNKIFMVRNTVFEMIQSQTKIFILSKNIARRSREITQIARKPLEEADLSEDSSSVSESESINDDSDSSLEEEDSESFELSEISDNSTFMKRDEKSADEELKMVCEEEEIASKYQEALEEQYKKIIDFNAFSDDFLKNFKINPKLAFSVLEAYGNKFHKEELIDDTAFSTDCLGYADGRISQAARFAGKDGFLTQEEIRRAILELKYANAAIQKYKEAHS